MFLSLILLDKYGSQVKVEISHKKVLYSWHVVQERNWKGESSDKEKGKTSDLRLDKGNYPWILLLSRTKLWNL